MENDIQFKTIKDIDNFIEELLNKKLITPSNLSLKTNIKIIFDDIITDKIIDTIFENNMLLHGEEILLTLDDNFKTKSLDSLIKKWNKRKINKRLLSENRIIECYDKYLENLSVASYKRLNNEKLIISRNLNAFQALKEFSIRNTQLTYSILCLNLPEELENYDDVLKYQLRIDEFYFGMKKE